MYEYLLRWEGPQALDVLEQERSAQAYAPYIKCHQSVPFRRAKKAEIVGGKGGGGGGREYMGSRLFQIVQMQKLKGGRDTWVGRSGSTL